MFARSMSTVSAAPHLRTLATVAAACVAVLASHLGYARPAFQDPLDNPAVMRKNIASRPLMAVTNAGERLVAVGSRGLILTSDDKGENWVQARVPVQSDLLAAHFPTPKKGWAVGHDGVILHSADGGESWVKQLDGRDAGERFKAHYEKAIANGEAGLEPYLDLLARNFKAGAALPYLDVWFENDQRGYVVGSFGMIAGTTDGGRSWQPFLDRIDNPEGLNLNSIRGFGDELFIVGERGLICELDRASGRFVGRPTDSAGSFFGIAGNGKVLLAYGLRGTAYRSRDGGTSWERVNVPVDATLTAATVNPEAQTFLLVNSAGQMLVGSADGASLEIRRPAKPMRFTSVAAIDPERVVVSGLGGIRTEAFPR